MDLVPSLGMLVGDRMNTLMMVTPSAAMDTTCCYGCLLGALAGWSADALSANAASCEHETVVAAAATSPW